MHQYDKSSKWLIRHHGDSILRLAGVRDIASWKPLQAELVQNRRFPDGLIEVLRHGQTEPDLFVLEISTYPYARLSAQTVDDALLVHLDRKTLPEVVALFLHPRGNARAANAVKLQSPLILGGRKAMIESPVLQELRKEWTTEGKLEGKRDAIAKVLQARFGSVASPLEPELKAAQDDRLDDLLEIAATCRGLASFRKQLKS